jgi:hypothetical protein
MSERHQLHVGMAVSKAIKAILEPIIQLFTRNRRHLKESRERQEAINFFWLTRNMTAAEIVDFNQNHGGLLSGASFEKDWRWAIFQRTGRALPKEEKPIQK